MTPVNNRIQIIDSLRGFALFGLFVIHTLEHFDFNMYPAGEPSWLATLNGHIYETVFFLFAGKAYAIFSLMFGLSFFIQMDRQAQKGTDFTLRFGWRLLILLGLGYLHGLFYCGDVLTVFALLGLTLLFLYRLPTKCLLILSAACILQIPFIVQFIQSMTDPAYQLPQSRMIALFIGGAHVYSTGSFLDVVQYNSWSGQLAKWLFYIDYGRTWQIIALFIWGILLGKTRFFEHYERHLPLCRPILVPALGSVLALFELNRLIPDFGLSEASAAIASKTVTSYANIAFTLILISGFILLYAGKHWQPVLNRLAPVGKMSLTCYTSQSIIGTIVFYHYGLGMYAHLGVALSLVYGILFFGLQMALAPIWLRHFSYGPLEWLWRCLTFTTLNVPFRKHRP